MNAIFSECYDEFFLKLEEAVKSCIELSEDSLPSEIIFNYFGFRVNITEIVNNERKLRRG